MLKLNFALVPLLIFFYYSLTYKQNHVKLGEKSANEFIDKRDCQ